MKLLRSYLLSTLVLFLCLTNCQRPAVDPAPATGPSAPTRYNNLALGNPSNAGSTNVNNLLMGKGT